eukprot:g4533.t1
MGNCSTVLGVKVRRAADLSDELHEAIQAGDRDLAENLLADGAPLEATNDRNLTPLQAAVYKGNAEIVQLLATRGADTDAWDGVGQTPLVLACGKGDHAVAEALLAAGATAGRRSDVFTALILAAKRGHALVLAALIRHGVDVNEPSLFGTALHYVANFNRPDAVDILVAAGADTDARDEDGGTPLHFASSALCLEAALALLKHGAGVNSRESLGSTPLHAAARQAGRRRAADMVDLLLRWGADETATDRFGQTPADAVERICYAGSEVGGVERVRELLANAPAERTWRRRGLLVASRARQRMVYLRASTQAPGEWTDLMDRVLGLAEEGVFRTIVGYL